MRLLYLSSFLILCLATTISYGQPTTTYRQDFDYFWQTIGENYCYWDKKQTDWQRVKEIYAPQADTASSKYSFLMLMERVMHELYDHHASLNANTRESSKLVPSGTDIWAEYRDGVPLVIEVRPGSGAAAAGLQPGMELVAFNDVPITEAIRRFLPQALRKNDMEAQDYGLRVLLAGTHNGKRKISVEQGGERRDFYPDGFPPVRYAGDIEVRKYGGIGYLRINDVLWKNELIPHFDSVMRTLSACKALVLDLRETPSGGNTTVARAILGKFITKAGYYQQHELTAEETHTGIKRSWAEIVSPRPQPYTRPLVVLVNHWTGSVGEGIAIGFDELKRATIIGTEMARLNGAIYSYRMPGSGIGFSFPAERLFHMNGRPRELFTPGILIKPVAGRDVAMETALRRLAKYR